MKELMRQLTQKGSRVNSQLRWESQPPRSICSTSVARHSGDSRLLGTWRGFRGANVKPTDLVCTTSACIVKPTTGSKAAWQGLHRLQISGTHVLQHALQLRCELSLGKTDPDQ